MAFDFRRMRETAEANSFMKTGTKYKNYGSRQGVSAVMDQGIIKKNVEDEMRAFNIDPEKPLSSQGAYCFRLTNSDGSDLNKAVALPFGNRIHYPNDDGIFRIVDGAYLDKAEKIYKEEQEYVDDMLGKAMISDEMCAYLVGEDVDKVRRILQEGGVVFGNVTQDGFNGCPDYISLLDRSSVAFSSSLNKLRAYIRKKAPIVEKVTNNAQIKEAE
jgi:hypothetical protein